MKYSHKIEMLVRAIIQEKGKILVCRKGGKMYYFFPGGHVEFKESAKKALARELKEELGINIKKASFIGASEHCFAEDETKHLAVKDTGAGIPKEEQKELFTRLFERGKEAEKLHSTGKGIGLYITYHIIKAHHGRTPKYPAYSGNYGAGLGRARGQG